jgi:hypothetical protein
MALGGAVSKARSTTSRSPRLAHGEHVEIDLRWPNWSLSHCCHKVLVAALDIWMILIARNPGRASQEAVIHLLLSKSYPVIAPMSLMPSGNVPWPEAVPAHGALNVVMAPSRARTKP